jgi:hypothetical protein
MRALSVVLAVSLVSGGSLSAQQPSNTMLLDRAAAYLAELLPRLTNVVAEERYTQRIASPAARRELVSDYLLVRVQESGDVAAFRDVYEVDGASVRNRDERLQRLFVDSPRTAVEQASAINRESARHNIWNIGTISNPYLTVAFIQPAYRSRFRFQSPRRERDLGEDVWAVSYEEFVRPTILRGAGNRDTFARGRLWIEATTGRVLKSELLLGANSVRLGLTPIEVTTTFRHDADLDLMLPVEMREFYPDGRVGDVRGVATYGRFRRFGVQTEETFAK